MSFILFFYGRISRMVEEGLAIIKKQKVHKAKIEAARELRKKKNNYMGQEMIDRVPWRRHTVDAKN
ncbi:hypothetical protein Patl1_13969 [Pistacia atlantica]|uniref:Uncharacterized protein n=1 Tax=Pistacia atlantica TaxID=434234 RepID=A0ACC1AUR9_9ROSI|nr:hypothetical protein Patl1_13969 [Pistacia atlantica]